MKRFLQLLMLTGLLFGQDVLILKSGESYKGHYVGKVDEQLVFSIADLNHLFFTGTNMKFPINDVEIIVTKNGELTYPFDKEYPRILGFMPTASFGVEYNISRKTQIKMGAWAGALLSTGEYPVFPFVTLNRRF